MATAVPVLERTRQESALKAYGKLGGGVAPQEMTEEQKALAFNARISENYKRLIDPDYDKAQPAAAAAEQPVFAQAAYAAPEREQPAYTRQRASEIFRADSPLNARAVEFAAAPVYAEPAYAAPAEVPYTEQGMAETADEADLMPTETTNQYRDNLYREEQRAEAVTEKKKGFVLSARNKLLITVYSIVVAVILTLIIVNTSVINALDTAIAARSEELAAAQTEQASLEAKIDEYTDPASIISRAEEIGMKFPQA